MVLPRRPTTRAGWSRRPSGRVAAMASGEAGDTGVPDARLVVGRVDRDVGVGRGARGRRAAREQERRGEEEREQRAGSHRCVVHDRRRSTARATPSCATVALMVRIGLRVLGCVVASVGLGCTPRPAPTPAPTAAPVVSQSAPGDPLRCPLALRSYELGVPDAGPPTAPFVSGDGVFAAFPEARADGSGYDFVAARLARDGALRPGARFERAAPGMSVLAAGYGEALRAPARIGERWMLVSFDASSGGGQADAPAPTLPGAPSDVVLGPRGLVALYDDATHRTVARELEHRAQPAVTLPRPPSSTVPSEQLLASGADVDVLLLPTSTAVRFVVLRPGEAAPARDEVGFERGESSVAAGPSGFAVVHGDPTFTRLTLRRFDRAGAPAGEPTAIPAS